MKSIKEVKSLSDKRILLRLDLNVPIVNGKIADTTRIDKILPTLKFLIKENSKIITTEPNDHLLFSSKNKG